jgi:hypothetical protein
VVTRIGARGPFRARPATGQPRPSPGLQATKLPPLPNQAAWADPAHGWSWPLERLPAEVGIPLWAPDRALMCGPTTPFSHLELWVRPVQLDSSPRGPGRLGLAGGLFGRWDYGLGLNRTVIMSTRLHPVPVAGPGVRPTELRWECGPPRGHVPRACSAGCAVFSGDIPQAPQGRSAHERPPATHAWDKPGQVTLA